MPPFHSTCHCPICHRPLSPCTKEMVACAAGGCLRSSDYFKLSCADVPLPPSALHHVSHTHLYSTWVMPRGTFPPHSHKYTPSSHLPPCLSPPPTRHHVSLFHFQLPHPNAQDRFLATDFRRTSPPPP
eukprot:Sspe_Gene.81904::Locus_53175_Transcript_1_1_Confidence_1.000_Length_511::g.81904::m.81904